MQQSDSNDYSCAACGYLLRGLRRQGRCPECGMSIRASILHARRLAKKPGRYILLVIYTLGIGLAAIWATLHLGTRLFPRWWMDNASWVLFIATVVAASVIVRKSLTMGIVVLIICTVLVLANHLFLSYVRGMA